MSLPPGWQIADGRGILDDGFVALVMNGVIRAQVNYAEHRDETLISHVSYGPEFGDTDAAKAMLERLLAKTRGKLRLGWNAGQDATRWWDAVKLAIPLDRWQGHELPVIHP